MVNSSGLYYLQYTAFANPRSTALNTTDNTVAFISVLVDALSNLREVMLNGVKEYELIQTLQKPPYCLFNEAALSASDTLFRAHFLLFHGLYLLRRQWRTEGVGELNIHTTNIQLIPRLTPEDTLVSDDPLETYYLDLNILASTSSDDVDNLIADFWRMMQGKSLKPISQTEIEHAHHILQLPFEHNAPPSRTQLKTAYRKRLHQIHPDKGGSADDAKVLITAYNDLVRHYAR